MLGAHEAFSLGQQVRMDQLRALRTMERHSAADSPADSPAT
ncbi:hypothetical protein [Streptomyces finlayi]|nr:hypothetical protein [Streptomyces finlayi]